METIGRAPGGLAMNPAGAGSVREIDDHDISQDEADITALKNRNPVPVARRPVT